LAALAPAQTRKAFWFMSPCLAQSGWSLCLPLRTKLSGRRYFLWRSALHVAVVSVADILADSHQPKAFYE